MKHIQKTLYVGVTFSYHQPWDPHSSHSDCTREDTTHSLYPKVRPYLAIGTSPLFLGFNATNSSTCETRAAFMECLTKQLHVERNTKISIIPLLLLGTPRRYLLGSHFFYSFFFLLTPFSFSQVLMPSHTLDLACLSQVAPH